MKMKKNTLLLLTMVSFIVFACQKKHICECTLIDNTSGATTIKSDTAKVNKKDATVWCNGHGAGSNYKTTCVLK